MKTLRDWFVVSPAACVFAVYLAGNLFMPIASFEHLGNQSHAMVQVLGNALPYGSWINRATFLGPVVLILTICIAWRNRWSPAFHWLDALVGLWILTPALVGVFNDSPYSADLLQCLYLALAWGAPYLASRIACNSPLDSYRILQITCFFGVATFALALLEFFFGRFLYSVLYGFHPFYLEGVSRFIGYRPILFFEDPNQIAMWWMTVAVASLTLLNGRVRNQLPRWWLFALTTTPFLFQAFGASILTILGALLLTVRNRKTIRNFVIGMLMVTIFIFVLRGPLLRFGREFVDSNPAGKYVRSILRESSIGSFGWRLAMEDDTYSIVKQRPLCGWGTINFWRTDNQAQKRPWGFVTLVAGAYGFMGVGIWTMMMLIPSCLIMIRRINAPTTAAPIDGLAIMVGLHCADALLNSAFVLPGVFFLGVLVSSIASRRSVI